MKRKIACLYTSILCMIALNIEAQNANTALSNLTSPTSMNQSLLVDKDNAHNIGSITKAWKNLYLDSAIYINSTRFVSGIGNGNTAIGKNVLNMNHGSNNTGNGFNALYSNKYGNENTAVGSSALYNNVNSDNTAIGFHAIYAGNGSIFASATGYEALYNDAGYANTATGAQAMYSNTTGQNNTALGFNALYGNLTGNNNVAIGLSALTQSTALSNIVAVGNNALNSLSDGSGHSTAIGSQAGYNDVDGSNNTYLGYHAGNTVEEGSSNTIIGYGADLSDGNYNNATALGNSAIAHASNSVRIGNSSVTSIGGFANWSNVSDGRIKKNIKQNVPGLAFINKLNPITYNLDLNAADKINNHTAVKGEDGNFIQLTDEELAARKQKEQIVYSGFIAQDVEKSAKELSYDFSGVDAAKNDRDLYELRYSDFVVPLVKAVQELSKMNNAKDANIDSLKFEIENLKSKMEELKAMIVSSQSMVDSQQSTGLSPASLSQNIPNPFSNSTTINYSLPVKFSSAKIIVTDKSGNVLKQINLSANKGSVNIDASTLASGAYQYSLYVDGKLVGSKQMIIAK